MNEEGKGEGELRNGKQSGAIFENNTYINPNSCPTYKLDS
jgi:hypothetical protein